MVTTFLIFRQSFDLSIGENFIQIEVCQARRPVREKTHQVVRAQKLRQFLLYTFSLEAHASRKLSRALADKTFDVSRIIVGISAQVEERIFSGCGVIIRSAIIIRHSSQFIKHSLLMFEL